MNALTNRPTQLNLLLRLTGIGLILFALFAIASPAAAQENGVVTGTVLNATTGEPEAGVEVTLSQFADQTGQNSVDTTTTTGDDGTFRFDGLDTTDGLAYAVSSRFMGVLYATTMILLSETPEQQADVTVYETTTDQSAVSIPTRGLIVSGIDRETGQLSITDAYTFEVAGNHTVVEGGDGYSVRFPVPENVEEITPRPGFNFGTARIEETDVLVATPLLPGQTNASLDYTFKYTEDDIDIPIPAAYPTGSIQILVPADLEDGEIAISADGLPLLDGGVVAISERDYHVWTVSNLQPEATMTLTISGLPSPPAARQLSTLEPAILAGLALLAAASITGWLVYSRGLHKQRPVVLAPAAAAPLDVRREQLSTDLRDLEARWQAGDLDEATYRTTRHTILDDLRRISRQYRGLGDDE